MSMKEEEMIEKLRKEVEIPDKSGRRPMKPLLL